MPTKSLNDIEFEGLGVLGYTGTINDRFKAFWHDQSQVANNATLGQDAQNTFYSRASGQSANDAALTYWAGQDLDTWATIVGTWAANTESWANT